MTLAMLWKRNSLARRMVWLFLLTVILPVSLAGVFFYQYLTHSLHKEIMVYSERMMYEKNNYYQLIMDHFYQYADHAVDRPEIHEILKLLQESNDPSNLNLQASVHKASRWLGDGLIRYSLRKIELIGNDGQGIAFSGVTQVAYYKPEFLLQLSKRFHESYQQQLSWHWLDDSTVQPKDRLLAWIPVLDSSSRHIEGYIFFYLDMPLFHQQFISNNQYGQYFVVANQDRLLLYYPDEKRIGTYLQKDQLEKIIKKTPTTMSDFNNHLSIISYINLQPMNWYFLSFIPFRYIRSRTVGVLSIIVLIILMLLALSVGFSIYLSRYYLAPIERITLHFKKFQQGMIESEGIEEKSTNEIADLNRWFNLFLSHYREKQVTDQKLIESEKQYQTLVNSIREILFRVDFRARFTFINNTWEDITQYSVREAVNTSFYNYVHEQDVIKARYLFEQIFTKELSIKEEIRLLRKDRAVRWVEIIAQSQVDPITLKKTISGIMIDMTERKELDLLKDDFISAVCHEIKTPFTAIKEAIQIFKDSYEHTLDDADRQVVLQILHRNTRRFQRLIDDLFVIREIEDGGESFIIRRHNFNQVIARVAEDMRPMAEAKQLEFNSSLDETIPLMEFDESKISRAVRHLLDNAIRYTEKGSIRLKTRKLGDRVRVSVRDTGIGISKEDYHKLFIQFSQISCGIRRKTGGLGLGLVIAKKIIEYHGGKIWIESEENKGSKFVFEMPIRNNGK